MDFHAFMYVTIGRRHTEIFLLFAENVIPRFR